MMVIVLAELNSLYDIIVKFTPGRACDDTR